MKLTRPNYSLKPGDGGFFVMPRGVEAIAEHYGGPVDWFEDENEAAKFISQLEAQQADTRGGDVSGEGREGEV